ncbi:hypothetical protein GQF03_01405 [Sneathiella chungangensis]|uniref:OmpH family outer membrane protein n=1 Tax=Sneathiella chungangensis TaxID=1418234 RepID=A0A845M7Q9_9PROT|nr:OmpH family outer membrane protein [Sneathiella chungangensis]MZR20983.1 hypothetical protein [Sneathiella chungangensis]
MLTRMMKIVSLLFFMLAFVVQPGFAEPMVKASIGVVDMQKIMSELAVVKDINSQIKALEEKTNADLSAMEEKLKEEKSQIERQKTLVTPEAFAEKQAAFNRKVATFRVEVKDKTAQLQRSRINALSKIREQILPVMRKVMDEYGATVVLDVSEILFAEKPLNLTEPVIERLNKDLKKIKVDLVPLKKS